jgi:hypothetical protein
MGLWRGLIRSINLILMDFYLWGYLRALVYAEKIQSTAHLSKHIINARNTVISDTIYHVTADWIPHLHL